MTIWHWVGLIASFFVGWVAIECSPFARRRRRELDQFILRSFIGPTGPIFSLVLMKDLGLKHWTVYRRLRSLEERGLLTSRDSAFPLPERGNRPRRLYEITPAGRQWLTGEPP